jgi:Tfp pilus assembly protein PilO
MSEIVQTRPKATSFNLREQLSVLNLHWAGVALLALVNLYLFVSLIVLWQKSKSQDADARAQQRVTLQMAQVAARPLDGLDEKLAKANRQADTFYVDRLPVSYSEIATELGVLKSKNNVRLSGANYSQEPVKNVSVGPLTEIKIDARLSGDYTGLAELINALERDRMFFIIDGVALTGQESGRVNLRIRLTTYMRGLSSDEAAAQASTPIADDDNGSTASAEPVAGGRR